MTDETGLLDALFRPRSVAIVGASADANKHSSLVQRNLRQHGFDGALYPINPRQAEVLGEPAYPSLAAIGAPVEHAFINLPTAGVLAAVEACGAAGVRCATVLANGFAEAGPDGAALQARVLEAARAGGVRLLGPNSMGLVDAGAGVTLTSSQALAAPGLQAGSYALLSQSGSMLGALLSRGKTRGIGFSKVVSLGNEADLGVAEIGDLLVDDPATDTILLFLETVRDAPGLLAMARRAHGAGKPVIALRLGRSEIGAQLAASHTGALAGSGPALEALLRDCGIALVRTVEALLEGPPLFRGRRPRGGRRVAVMTTTGGGGGLVVDSLAEAGLTIAPPTPAVLERVAELGLPVSASPLLDLTLLGTNARAYGGVLDALLAADHADIVAAVAGASAQTRPDRAVQPIAEAAARWPDRPLVAFFTPDAGPALQMMAQAGVAAFRTAEALADTVRAFAEWQAPRPPPPPCPAIAVAGPAGDVLDALGIERPASVLLSPGAPAPAGLRYPVAVKIASPDILHKTEAGGVVLGVTDADGVARACDAVLASAARHAPGARLEGCTVESMERGLLEVLVGYRRDPCAGPTVVLGAGGVLAEIYRDFAVRTAPVTEAVAHEMIAELRGLVPIRGYRGLPRGDLDALARAVVAMSFLAGSAAQEAEINPLLVRAAGEGVVALDFVAVTG